MAQLQMPTIKGTIQDSDQSSCHLGIRTVQSVPTTVAETCVTKRLLSALPGSITDPALENTGENGGGHPGWRELLPSLSLFSFWPTFF